MTSVDTLDTEQNGLFNRKNEESTTKSKIKKALKQNLLTFATFGGVIAGLILGFALRGATEWTDRKVMYLNYPGELFLRMLKCLILPLIMSSLVAALGNLDLKLSGKIGVRAVIYYMGTTVIAVILGIVLVSSIQPGSVDPEDIDKEGEGRNVTTVDTLLDLVRNLFPPNIVQAAFFQYQTILKYPTKKKKMKVENETMELNMKSAKVDEIDAKLQEAIQKNINGTMENNMTKPEDKEISLYDWDIENGYGGGTNILGIVVFSIALGITLGLMKEKGKALLDVFISLNDAVMIITKWVIWLSPIGVTFLVASKIVGTKSFEKMFNQLGLYTLTVLAGLFIHGLVILPTLYFIFVRSLPFRFIANLLQALSTAFGTSSSSATLPVTIGCLEEKNNVDPLVSRFCLPIGATINMDGTALYEAVAALFIAQLRRVPLDITKIIAVSITSTAASIGAAGIPQAGLVTMVMVLNVVGLPADDVAYIITVDWFLDRFRTMINVLGDSIGAGIVNHLSRKDIEEMNKLTEAERDDKLEQSTAM